MTYPALDPVIFCLGPFCVRWYGLMYVFGFLASYWLVKKQIAEFAFLPLEKHFENLNLLLILSVVVGGRLGYVIFYNWSYYRDHLLEIPATWSGGMSFHGACLALIVSGWLFCTYKKIDFWKTADIYIVTIPVGLGFGRIGNFINGELFGRVTNSPLAMVFPMAGPQPRHPSQLYEAGLEGVLLFVLLWSLRKFPWRTKKLPHGAMLCFFLVGYGVFRVIVENFREPDAQLGFVIGSLTMGQLLSLIMIGSGLVLFGFRYWQQRKNIDHLF